MLAFILEVLGFVWYHIEFVVLFAVVFWLMANDEL